MTQIIITMLNTLTCDMSLRYNIFDRSQFIPNKEVKCITIFSHLIKNNRHIKMNLDILRPNFQLSYDWFPMDSISFIYFSIHSPNTLPELTLENFMLMNPQTHYRFAYSLIKTELLNSRYDTNCFDYDLDHKFANYNMRSDCITHCCQKHIRCNISELIPSDFLLRNDYLEQNKQIKLSDYKYCAISIWKQTKAFCSEQCQFAYPDIIFLI